MHLLAIGGDALLLTLLIIGPLIAFYGAYQLVGDLRSVPKKKVMGRLKGRMSTQGGEAAGFNFEDLRKQGPEVVGSLGQMFSKFSFTERLQTTLEQANISWSASKLLVNLTLVASILSALLMALQPSLLAAAGGYIPDDLELSLGKVTYRSVVADAATRTYSVEVTVENPRLKLLPGMIVRAVLVRRIIEGALSVPLEAVVPLEGRYVVFLENNGHASEVEVKLGITDGRDIQVVEGLAAGDRLIVEGQRQLRDSQAVVVNGQGEESG